MFSLGNFIVKINFTFIFSSYLFISLISPFLRCSFGKNCFLVFDTDKDNVKILNDNIKALKTCTAVSKVITIPQVSNVEDELVRSCNIRQIKELLNSRSNSAFKSDIIKVTNLHSKLKEHQFNIDLFWNSTPAEPFSHIVNGAKGIKLRK